MGKIMCAEVYPMDYGGAFFSAPGIKEPRSIPFECVYAGDIIMTAPRGRGAWFSGIKVEMNRRAFIRDFYSDLGNGAINKNHGNCFSLKNDQVLW